MKLDCIKICQSLQPVQKEAARFGYSPSIKATWKGRGPFRLWAIDLVAKLQPPGKHGEITLVVAVCPFSKWVEAAPLEDKSSHSVATWFHSQVVCRFGVPWGIRMD